MLERQFQAQLIRRLRKEFPGCVILKNDSSYLQGIPDLTIFYLDRWAMLEVKASLDYKFEPNQEWYLEQLNEMSYASVICPETEEDVLYELSLALKSRG